MLEIAQDLARTNATSSHCASCAARRARRRPSQAMPSDVRVLCGALARRGRAGLTSGMLNMLLASFFQSLTALAVHATPELGAEAAVLVRGLGCFPLTLAIIATQHKDTGGLRAIGGRSRTNLSLLFVRGVLGNGAMVARFEALRRLELGDCVTIFSSSPLFTALLAVPILGERLSRWDAVVTPLALAGVALVAQTHFIFGDPPQPAALFKPVVDSGDDAGRGGGGESSTGAGATIALVGAVIGGAAQAVARLMASHRGEHPLIVTSWYHLLSLPFGLFSIVIGAEPPWPLPPKAAGMCVSIVATSFLGQVFLSRGLAFAKSAGAATSANYTQIVWSFVWSAAFLGEVPAVATVLGALLIAGAVTARGMAGSLSQPALKTSRSERYLPDVVEYDVDDVELVALVSDDTGSQADFDMGEEQAAPSA